MSARDMRNLLLEYRAGNWYGDFVDVALANIPGHCFTFGTLYPGERGGEDFIFCRGYMSGLISPSHCTIRVDDQGQYRIQNDGGGRSSISFYDTFVNSVRVEGSESRLLKSGDIISLGAPETDWDEDGLPPHPIYRVKGRATLSSDLQIEGEAKNEGVEGGPKEGEAQAESPFDNDLIFAKMMSYLPFRDVKNARLVSKRWNGGASEFVEKKGKIIFSFGVDYINPEWSTRVSRYLKEVEGLKPRNVRIYLGIIDPWDISPDPSLMQDPLLFSPGEPGDKMMSDLQKLLNSSHNFSNVYLTCGTIDEEVAHPFSLILQDLGEKLVELKFEGNLKFPPEAMPPLPLMPNLKQLIHDEKRERELKIDQKCVSSLVPLFAQSLEHFQFRADVGKDHVEHYLQEFVQHEMPNLREIYINWEYGRKYEISEKSLSHLLQLKTPLTALGFSYKKYRSESGDGCTLLEKLLLKNYSSLENLIMEVSHEDIEKQIEIRFPPFPKLEELDLSYRAAPSKMRITWKSGELDYKKHFPSLGRLSIVNRFCTSRRDYADEDDPVFNSFFPGGDGGEVEVRCETVTDLCVSEVKAAPRMDWIKETFPNAELSFVCEYYVDGYVN